MDASIRPARPGTPVSPLGPSPDRPSEAARAAHDQFLAVLSQAGIEISKHAQARLARSGLASAEGERLRDAIARAEAKEVDTAAVLLDDLTFIVSVPQRRLITAVGPERARDQVFTDIDGVVKA